MPTSTVQVQYLDGPDPSKNKKNGSFKDTSGQKYVVPPEKLGELTRGETYDIFYEDMQGKFGAWRLVHTITPAPKPNNVPAAAKVLAQVYPKTTDGVGDRDTKRHIFVCGAINNAVRGQGLEALCDTDKVMATIDSCTRGYDRSLLANPQKSEDMSDEVPFA